MTMAASLVPGVILPDFELSDDEGVKRRLSELQGDNPMVLHLSRGEHCPRERQHLRELVKFHEWCAVAFTELVTVMPNDAEDTHKMKIATGARWPFLCDIDLRVQCHFDINEYTDTVHDYAMVPHTLVVAPGLTVDKVYVGYWFWGRPSAYDLWGDLRDLNRRIRADFDPTEPEARAQWEAANA